VTILTACLAFIEPMKPTLVDSPPAGDDWLHELKYDGFRTELIVDGDESRAFTRTGLDWSRSSTPCAHSGASARSSTAR
jgi:bifunctional non-homologous end joining protein LigD